MLEQAIVFEENGDRISAEIKMMQAEMVSNLDSKTKSAALKIKGISSPKRWKCRITDNELVPAFLMELRLER